MAEFESSRPSASISSESQGASNVDSSTTASTSNNNASSAQQQQQPPTIVYYGAKMVRCRVERNVPLEEIVRQLCNSSQLGVGQPPVLFALRDTANNELITQDNLARKIDGKASFKLVSSPVIEAADTIERFESGDLQVIKEATFALRSYIREEPFLDEFVRRNGVKALAGVILEATGNTLAYALSAMQSILDLDHGVDDLDLHFVRKTVHIISSQALVNILRPALSILRRLVTADHPSFGFNAIWPCLTQEERFFKALGSRITREGDKLLTGGALALLNSILKVVPRTALLEVLEKLEAFNFRKAVISLIENRTEDVTPQILQFQQNYANIWYELQMQAVELGDVKHIAMLQSVYEHSGLHTENYDAAQYDYRKLGFTSSPPNIIGDFQDAGLLGLHMLHHLATTRTSEFAAVILEQVNRPDPRRCPVALVALQVSLILSEQFDLSGSLASAAFQPFLLDIYRIHLVVTEFFIRMYSDSGATLADFARVSTLVTSQVRFTLGRGALDYQSPSADVEPKTFFAIKQDFEDARYEEVRDRQMKEMEIEDDLLSKMPVRNLRDRLYRESFEFIRAQRIHCLQGGAWFTVAQSTHNNLSVSQRQRPVQGARYRFYRLAPNRRFLHFVESPERRQIRAGLDELPEKLDLSVVSDIIGAQSGRASLANQRSLSDAASPPTSSSAQSLKAPIQMGAGAQTASLSISLISQDSVIAELVAPDQATYTEWLDGLNLLLPDGFISTKATADFIQVLTDVGVKIKLLDLTGERLDIPAALPTPIVPPPSVPFYYAE